MNKLTSILAAVDRGDAAHHVLAKALILARHFGAAVELFLCDSEHAYTLRHAYARTGVDEARRACLVDGRRYLEALRQSVAAEDVRVSIDVACESPLSEAIVHKVLTGYPDLVVKCAAGEQPVHQFGLDANDWQLVRTCPVPLMLTRGRPWQPRPRFAAAVDVSEEESPGLARAILQMSEYLTLGCQGDLDMVYGEDADVGPAEHDAHAAALWQLSREFHLGSDRVHLVSGAPGKTLPAFAAEQGYDVLVLGALTHRASLAALVGTLTGRLVDALDCDFVLIKPGTYRCPAQDDASATAQT